MRFLVLWLGLLPAATAASFTIHGTVLDPSGAAIPGGQVSAVNRLGVAQQTTTDQAGGFTLKLAESRDMHLAITAPGFETKTIPLPETPPVVPLTVRLNIAPQVDAVRVAGSVIDVPLSEQGSSVSIVPRAEIAERNEGLAVDLLRYMPGITIGQTGSPGGVADMFIRGGDYNFNLVQIDGVPVNSVGGAFDFAHIPTDFLERVEVIEGAQSAVYGAYANSGVVNFVTRAASDTPQIEVLAEGGTYQEHRFAIDASGIVAGFGVAVFASQFGDNGPVANSDYRNDNVSLHVTRAFGRQSLSFGGNYNANDVGDPGPYGSDPGHDFTGIDTISRDKNDFSDYFLHHQIDFSPRFRQETFASFFLENSGYTSPYGFSFEKDLRGQFETRSIVSVKPWYTAAFGVSLAREEVKNTYISGDDFNPFTIKRDDAGIYWENRFQVGSRFFFNAGVRGEIIGTPFIPENTSDGRPAFPASTVTKINPKLAATYILRAGTRLHTSFGTGIRPPAGLELAFTNNPALKPERTASFDFGVEQRAFHDKLSLDATYFYNRFYDLIVSLGGNLAVLSAYQTDNLSNARAQGAETAASYRPVRWISIRASYTYLDSEVLSLNGSTGLAPIPFTVGQELIRRPANSGSFVSTFARGRVTANLTGYFRGSDLDVDPTYGATAGLYPCHGFFNMGINLNLRLGEGLTAYGNLRNALNESYEEVLGYPAPKLNFVAGLKWSLPALKTNR
ncbi:MAG TPA: TonB-dependent receptor [Bryobacteraceae bacterium]|jgi:outer membrane receptor protein involved in Fe transport|nr:TonB-dependent receptor [Bryobacteraceae bacterium]